MIEFLFSFANPAVYFWLLLFFLPKWKVSQFLAKHALFPSYLATIYVICLTIVIAQGGLGFVTQFGSAEGVIRLMADPQFALVCWIHILCFDQAVGHYMYLDNMKQRYVPLPLQSVLLLMTLMFGPAGFVCYWIIRTIKKQKRQNALPTTE